MESEAAKESVVSGHHVLELQHCACYIAMVYTDWDHVRLIANVHLYNSDVRLITQFYGILYCSQVEISTSEIFLHL